MVNGENVLQPGQLVTHVVIPPPGQLLSAAYEVRHGEGPDQPLAAAAVSLDVSSGSRPASTDRARSSCTNSVGGAARGAIAARQTDQR